MKVKIRNISAQMYPKFEDRMKIPKEEGRQKQNKNTSHMVENDVVTKYIYFQTGVM